MNVWFHSYKASKIVKLTEAEKRTMATRDWEGGEMGSCCPKGIKLQLYKMGKFYISAV